MLVRFSFIFVVGGGGWELGAVWGWWFALLEIGGAMARVLIFLFFGGHG